MHQDNFLGRVLRAIQQLQSSDSSSRLLQYLLWLTVSAILIETQEVPTSLQVDGAIAQHGHKVFNTDINYYTDVVKLQAVAELQPEIIVYGNSWVNQFRTEMFAPHRMYNCSNLSAKLPAARSFILEAQAVNPELQLAIIMLHPWHFRTDIYEGSTAAAQNSEEAETQQPQISIAKYLNRLRKKDLYQLLTKLDTSKTIGIRAIPQNRGARLHDGSVSFGRHHDRSADQHTKREQRVTSKAAYHMLKKSYFRGYDQELDTRTIELLQELTDDLTAVGITTVYLIPPLHDEFRAIMSAEPEAYQLWHQLISDDVQDQLNAIAPTYDFSDFSDFGGTTEMSYDLWHSTELAAHLMVATMANDARSPALLHNLPQMELDSIRAYYPTPVAQIYDKP